MNTTTDVLWGETLALLPLPAKSSEPWLQEEPGCLLIDQIACLGFSFLYSMRKPFPLATSSSSSSFIKQADSVKMAEYWPSPLFFPLYLTFGVVFFVKRNPVNATTVGP